VIEYLHLLHLFLYYLLSIHSFLELNKEINE
jgi:hypothetical protein